MWQRLMEALFVFLAVVFTVQFGCFSHSNQGGDEEVRVLDSGNEGDFDDASDETGGSDVSGADVKPDDAEVKCESTIKRLGKGACDDTSWEVPTPEVSFEDEPWMPRKIIGGPRKSKAEMDAEWGAEGSRASVVWGLKPARWLDPGRLPFDLYAEPGKPFRMQLYVWFPDEFDSEGKSLFVSVFKNYRPTETTFEVRNSANTEVVREFKSTGERIPMNDRVLFVDAEIPAEQFEEGRGYEIALGLVVVDEEEGYITANQDRYWFYYGGLEPPKPPTCAPASRDETMEGFDMQVFDKFRNFRRDGLMVFPAEVNSVEGLKEYPEAYEVEESCTDLRVLGTYAVTDQGYHSRRDLSDVRSVAIPIVDWKPVDEPIYYERSINALTIDTRFDLMTHVPESGETTVFFMGWPFAFIPFRLPDGTRNDLVMSDGRTVSNFVKLRRAGTE